jgi:uncharacterized protein YcbK (DUF882 family)
MNHRVTRRGLLQAATGLLATLAVPVEAAAISRDRWLRFRHLHTGETLDITYASNGYYQPAALRDIDYLLRDFRTGEIRPIDPALLDVLCVVSSLTGSREPFEIISGFRSPVTNELLRRTGGGGVARHSLHLDGKAIDVRLPDIRLERLRASALSLRRGGVGYYPDAGFVHLDTGPVRRWTG